MRTGIPTRPALGLTAATVLAAVAMPPVSAELLLYEGFDYAVSSNLVGQNGGDWDTSRAWTTGGPSNGNINAATVVTGLTFSDYAVIGNAAQVVNNHNDASNSAAFAAGRQLPSDFRATRPRPPPRRPGPAEYPSPCQTRQPARIHLARPAGPWRAPRECAALRDRLPACRCAV